MRFNEKENFSRFNQKKRKKKEKEAFNSPVSCTLLLLYIYTAERCIFASLSQIPFAAYIIDFNLALSQLLALIYQTNQSNTMESQFAT